MAVIETTKPDPAAIRAGEHGLPVSESERQTAQDVFRLSLFQPPTPLVGAHWKEQIMKVKDAMHRHVTWVEKETALADVAARMREEDIGSIPVGENDRLVGMVTDRDIAIRAFDKATDPSKMKASDVMSKGIIYCRDNEELDDAVRLMESKKIRRLPVLDDNKRMVGMLSLGDIAHAAGKTLASETLTAVSAHHA